MKQLHFFHTMLYCLPVAKSTTGYWDSHLLELHVVFLVLLEQIPALTSNTLKMKIEGLV